MAIHFFPSIVQAEHDPMRTEGRSLFEIHETQFTESKQNAL